MKLVKFAKKGHANIEGFTVCFELSVHNLLLLQPEKSGNSHHIGVKRSDHKVLFELYIHFVGIP